jgi:AcrR family transcriptional regulator
VVETVARRPDGRRERWTEHRAERRAEFVAAGAAAVDKYGPEASAEQIAELAAISRTVLYRYFRDRDDLRQAVGEFIVRQVVDAVGDNLQLTATSTPRQLVEGAISAIVVWFDQHPNRYQFVRTLQNGSALEVAEHSLADQVAGLLRLVMATFGVSGGSAEPGAYGIVGLVESTAAWWLARRQLSREALIDLLCGSVWAIIDSFARSMDLHIEYDAPLPVGDLLQS